MNAEGGIILNFSSRVAGRDVTWPMEVVGREVSAFSNDIVLEGSDHEPIIDQRSRELRGRHRSRPGRRWLPVWAMALSSLLLVAVCYKIRSDLLVILMLAAATFNLTVGPLEARWRLYAWRTPDAARSVAWPESICAGDSQLTFSLIVAARDEAYVIADTLHGLMRQSHPAFEVVVTLCDDDVSTIAIVQEVAEQYQNHIRIVIGHYENPSKAHQLNTAMRICAGDVIGVIDAEDDVAPDLLLHVETLLIQSDADVAQGGVQLMNLGDSPGKWFQVHNVMEYFFWFNSRMAYQATTGFVPLGGNTVFVYRELLERAGGWPISLTEDCALGVRLSAMFGAKVATAYSAELSTREEVPPTVFNRQLGSLFWQRDRWIRGFLAELLNGKWLMMPTVRQRIYAGYILATPLLQCLSFLLVPLAIITSIATKTPIAIAILMYTPFVPIGIVTVSQLIGLREFAHTYRQKATIWHYASLVFLAPFYQLILLAAAAVAVYKYMSGDKRWYKTGRAAEHRQVMSASESDYYMTSY